MPFVHLNAADAEKVLHIFIRSCRVEKENGGRVDTLKECAQFVLMLEKKYCETESEPSRHKKKLKQREFR